MNAMDREIDADVRRRRRMKRLAAGLPAIALASAAFVILPGWLRPSVSRARILTAKVERGAVEAVIEASGTVLPAREAVLSSPIETRVVRILKRPGDAVRRGEALLDLDTEATKLDLQRIEDRLARKRNEETQSRLTLGRSLDDLRGRIRRAELDEQILDARHHRNLRMSTEGLVSDEDLKASEVEAAKSKIEVEQLRRQVESEQEATKAQIEGIALDLRTLANEAAEARHRLDLATARAEEDGVLTWTVPEEGASVRRGDILARVARLDAFRVEATVSDVHASKLAPGLPVKVIANGRELSGTLSTVYPKVENGAVRFGVDLREPSNAALRQSLRVDVFVVTGSRDKALRLRRGPYAQGGGAILQVFVVRGDLAARTAAGVGLTGRDFLEVVDGLAEGDEVIVSDMTDYVHLAQVRLR
jgi:HlyD family secretion protein